MIVTVTPNPSVDRTYELADLARGEVNRATGTRVDAGGKGINVSRALVAGGIASTAVFPAGGADGGRIVTALSELGVPAQAVPVLGETRSNITLAEVDGTTTKINAVGPTLDTRDAEHLLGAVAATLDASRASSAVPHVVVGAGSLPAGLADDFYQRLADVARRHGAEMVVDTSGEPFARVAASGCAAVLKPNDDELAELVGAELRTVGDVVDAARGLVRAGTHEVLVSLGAHGALLVTADAVHWAGGPALVPLSTVGAGDTTLAGYLSGGRPAGRRGADDVATAVAWGRAAVRLPGSAVPAPHQISLDDVRVVEEPDRTLALKEL
ncbi:1-phosphofructokinase family hexose kinase [Luteimicrobium subarcticum]|uniref:1-phosphofructokinase n=1 Tax=Luteimicrobium subarcticum TaxID=620910 RepID=A0A2M8WVA7_9MICO|nr:1-phosphofructokinase family hexose kinase [Luteimicrobium subarcticum]PJI94858.1 1-phosphofructokinase [Luteimicrobium subarcticum]